MCIYSFVSLWVSSYFSWSCIHITNDDPLPLSSVFAEYEKDNIAEDESDKYATPSSKTTEDYVTPERLDVSSESDVLNTSFCETSSSPTDIVEAVENEHGAHEDLPDEFSVSGDIDHQASASVDYNISLESGTPANVASIDALGDTGSPANAITHSLEPSLEDPPITVIENTNKIVVDVDNEPETSALPATEKAAEAEPVNEDLESCPAANPITQVCDETPTYVEIKSDKQIESVSPKSIGCEVPDNMTSASMENEPGVSKDSESSTSVSSIFEQCFDDETLTAVEEESSKDKEVDSSPVSNGTEVPDKTTVKVKDNLSETKDLESSSPANIVVEGSDDKTSTTIIEAESVENESLESFLPSNTDVEVSDDKIVMLDGENKLVGNEDSESSSPMNTVIEVSTPVATVEDQHSENENLESYSSANTIEVVPISKIESEFSETEDLDSSPAVRPLTEVCNETPANVEKQSVEHEWIESLPKSSGIEVSDDESAADVENKSSKHKDLETFSPANTVVEVSGGKTPTTKYEEESSKTEDLEASSPASTVASNAETPREVECIEIVIGGFTPADFVARHSDYQTAAEMECEPNASEDPEFSSRAHINIGVSNADTTVSIETESSKTEDVESSSLPTNLVTSVLDVASCTKADSESSESGEFDTCSSSVSAVILESEPAEDVKSTTAGCEPDQACEVLTSSPPAAVAIQTTESHEYPPEVSSPTETAVVGISSIKTAQKSNEIENESSSAKDTATEVTGDKAAEVETKSIETTAVRASAGKRPVLMTADNHKTEKRPKLADTANGDLREASFPQTHAGECVYNTTSTNGVSESTESDLVPAKAEKELALEDYQFVITHVNTPSSFYLQKVSDSERLKEIEASLRNIGTSELNELESPEIGQLVAVKICGLWLRVKIEQVDDFRGFMVLCIDYGTMCSCKKVFQLPEELRHIPPLIIHCAFKLPASVEGWSDHACQVFYDMTMTPSGKRTVTIKIVDEDIDVKYVELFDEKDSITEKIIALCDKEDEVDVE